MSLPSSWSNNKPSNKRVRNGTNYVLRNLCRILSDYTVVHPRGLKFEQFNFLIKCFGGVEKTEMSFVICTLSQV
jgi:hypothetical protein